MPSNEKSIQYAEVLSFYNEPRWSKISLGLDRIRLLLELLGNPQNNYAIVHVAGTNGKGSVCAYLSSILTYSGLKCGLFTSPFIERFEERIRVGGENISIDELKDVTEQIRDCSKIVERKLGEHPSEFELMCAAGLMHFSNVGCDVVVCEVGLGGRLDATNVVNPILCVITRIGLDHTEILGDAIDKIAMEKAGIIKPGVSVVSYPQDKAAMTIIERTCELRGCPLFVSDFSKLACCKAPDLGDGRESDLSGGALNDLANGHVRCRPSSSGLVRQFSYQGKRFETSMIADYQIRNAAIAIDAARILSRGPIPDIDEESIRDGIRSAKWPGRFEIIGRGPLFILDGAHNPQGASGLASTLKTFDLDKNGLTLICGMLADKECEKALEAMLPLAKRLITYTPDNPRAASSEDIAALAESICASNDMKVEIEDGKTPFEAVSHALHKEGPDGAIVAFGTLYAISDIKKAAMLLSGQ